MLVGKIPPLHNAEHHTEWGQDFLKLRIKLSIFTNMEQLVLKYLLFLQNRYLTYLFSIFPKNIRLSW